MAASTTRRLKRPASFGSFSSSLLRFAGRLGAGLDVYITKHILLTAGANAVLSTTDFELFGVDVDPLFYVGGQAGLQYRF